MISAGVDAGALTTKAVVLRDGEMCGFAVLPTEDDSRLAAEAALAEGGPGRGAGPAPGVCIGPPPPPQPRGGGGGGARSFL
jgi:hypothetical protein